jgi:hypothetical protein
MNGRQTCRPNMLRKNLPNHVKRKPASTALSAFEAGEGGARGSRTPDLLTASQAL